MLIFPKNIAAIDFVPDEIDPGCYRDEHTAEQWAAAAFIDRPEGATGIRYYIKLNPDGNHAAIYRIYQYIQKAERYGLFGDYWDWSTARWVMAEDIVRRYWSGFDADVEPASEAEVIHLIRTLRR